MANLVYALCAITSLACAILLLRGFARSRARLLLWSGLCFVGLFINNALLVVDARIVFDLSVVRSLPAVLGVVALLYGLVWESDR
jgi:hypothetical protein